MNARASVLAFLTLVLSAPAALAQESKSASLAKELASVLDAAKLDSIAAKDPSNKDVFFGALYVPNLQFIVVAGSYEQGILLDTRIFRRQYRDTYLDLQGASTPTTRLVVEDMGANGLNAKRAKDQPFDSVDQGGKRTMFNSDWKKQKLNETDYMKTFAATDERYAQILETLLKEAKRPN